MIRFGAKLFAVTFFCALLTGSAYAVETKVIRDAAFSDFNQGESTGTEVQALGRLLIAPQAKRLAKTEEGVAWRVAVDRHDGHVFFCTGHQGKVYHVFPDGKTELFADLPEVEAISIAVDFTGGVLVGASPGGKIYRIVTAGKPELFFDTKEQYVWDMIFDREGVLYAATGPNGKIFRIRGQNNGEVFFDSDATNVMGLAFDKDGRLIAATQGKAYIFRVTDLNKAYVLYSSEEDECRALTVDKQGNIYAAINSSRVSSVFDRPSGSESDARPASPSTSGSTPSSGTSGSSSENRPPTPSGPSEPRGLPTGGQSSIFQIQPNGFVSRFWQAPDGPVQCLIADPEDGILVGGGSKGKIYRLQSNTNYAVVQDVEESTVLSFALDRSKLYFTTANKASLYEAVTTPTLQGLFASRPLNAGASVKWGNILYDAEEPTGSDISFETRSGNTVQPEDSTWSNWVPAKRIGPRLFEVRSEISQYLQYRLTMKAGTDGKSPVLDNVQIFNIQQNVPPIIRNIRVDKVGGDVQMQELGSLTSGQPRAPVATPPSTGVSGRSSDAPPSGLSGMPAGTTIVSRVISGLGSGPSGLSSGRGEAESGPFSAALGAVANSQRFAVQWEAADPNGDKLQYRLSYKAEDETQWKELEKDLNAPRYVFMTEALPDGQYRIKVEATDILQNPEDTASTSSLVSRIFVIDNTPPEIPELKGTKVGKNEYEIEATAVDATSILSAAEYNIDAAKEWKAALPIDGIFDKNQEKFKFRVTPEKEYAEHTLSFRVYDREGNSRVAKVLLK